MNIALMNEKVIFQKCSVVKDGIGNHRNEWTEEDVYKRQEVDYEAYYLYCDLAEELYMDEKQMQDNDTRMKDSYREKKGLLTSTQISGIRAKYGISQSDLCVLLGWGGKTITLSLIHI